MKKPLPVNDSIVCPTMRVQSKYLAHAIDALKTIEIEHPATLSEITRTTFLLGLTRVLGPDFPNTEPSEAAWKTLALISSQARKRTDSSIIQNIAKITNQKFPQTLLQNLPENQQVQGQRILNLLNSDKLTIETHLQNATDEVKLLTAKLLSQVTDQLNETTRMMVVHILNTKQKA